MKQLPYSFIVVLLIGMFLLTHLPSLSALPVFADESIYIRWAQLLISDPQQYLFFALNDGKTPLFIWSLVPSLGVIADPLVASRLVSVVVGSVQMLVMMLIIHALGGSKRAQVAGAVGVLLLPFWYFHHRMALMDGLLTLFLSLYFWMSIRLVHLPLEKQPKNVVSVVLQALVGRQSVVPIVVAGFFLGLALWTKLPAVLFVPSIFCLVFLKKRTRVEYFAVGARLLGTVIVGALVFSSILLHPAASQLFSRGSDFLFSTDEIMQGYWLHGIANIPSYIQYFIAYLTPEVLLLVLAGLLIRKQARLHWVLFFATVCFFLPVAVLGKVVYPRYYLPVAIFMTASAGLVLDSLMSMIANLPALTTRKLLLAILVVSIVGRVATTSFSFMYYSLVNTDAVPFVSADRTQYLTEWSSGHGVVEVASLIEAQSQTHSLAVATEGFFGTLPDALLMYFENKNHENLVIEGIGQPVAGLPTSFVEKARGYDTVWLVVNSHRLLMTLPPEKLVYEYCRPYAGPCLQVWDVGDEVGR